MIQEILKTEDSEHSEDFETSEDSENSDNSEKSVFFVFKITEKSRTDSTTHHGNNFLKFVKSFRS